MAKTWQNIIDEARVILQDRTEPFRYSTGTLTSVLNRGLQELGRIRPDAFYDRFLTDDILVPEVASSDADPDQDPDTVDEDEDSVVALTANFDLPMMYYAPLVFWVAANGELTDDEFTDDGRVAVLIDKFKSMLVGL